MANLFEHFSDEQLEATQCLFQSADESIMPCRETDPEFFVVIDDVAAQLESEFHDRFVGKTT